MFGLGASEMVVIGIQKQPTANTLRLTRDIDSVLADIQAALPDGMQIGVNLEEDKKRFHVTPNGIVLVTPNMLGQNLYSLEGEDYVWKPES